MILEIGRLYTGLDNHMYRILDIEIDSRGRQMVVMRDGRNRRGPIRFPLSDAAKRLREITPRNTDAQKS